MVAVVVALRIFMARYSLPFFARNTYPVAPDPRRRTQPKLSMRPIRMCVGWNRRGWEWMGLDGWGQVWVVVGGDGLEVHESWMVGVTKVNEDCGKSVGHTYAFMVFIEISTARRFCSEKMGRNERPCKNRSFGVLGGGGAAFSRLGIWILKIFSTFCRREQIFRMHTPPQTKSLQKVILCRIF